MKIFGLLKGLPHSNCNENFEDYQKYKNYDIGIPYDYEEYLKKKLGL